MARGNRIAVSIYLPPGLLDKVEEAAELDGLTVSSMVNVLIRRGLRDAG